MIAHRYVPLVCALLALALVPTFIHSYSENRPPDGHSAAALSAALASYSSTPTTRGPNWGKRRFDSDDWVERTYRTGTRSIRLTVVRSYDPESLYHHPELAVADGTGFSGVQVIPTGKAAGYACARADAGTRRQCLAAYVLHYGGRFVNDLILFRNAPPGSFSSPREREEPFFPLERKPSKGDLQQRRDKFSHSAVKNSLAGGSRPTGIN